MAASTHLRMRSEYSQFQAFCFDLDGTLVDTEILKKRAYGRAFQEVLGVDVTACDDTWMGRPEPDVVAYFMAWSGQTADDSCTQKIIETKRRIYEQFIASDVRAMPGADQVLHVLKNAGVRLALVTSSPRKHVLHILNCRAWHNLFDAIITADDVCTRKPSPEPYEKAAEKLGVTVAECMAVEDSQSGFLSAKAARMTCLCVGQQVTGCDVHIESLENLITH